MLKIAIVGNIASGKSTVEKMLTDKGFCVFDTDKISHEILESKSGIVKNVFKNFDISDEEGNISRKKLGKIVFNNQKYKTELENIIYPDLKIKINNIFEQNCNEKFIFISIPLLFEVGWEDMFDKVLFIEANDDIRLLRLMQRNNLTANEAGIRMAAQNIQSEKIKKSDFIIRNNDDIMFLQKQIDEIIILLEDME
ncbi:dephospho-CoA kinase [bacterium]|nr:dephospho-CoA kinase [bacterium]